MNTLMPDLLPPHQSRLDATPRCWRETMPEPPPILSGKAKCGNRRVDPWKHFFAAVLVELGWPHWRVRRFLGIGSTTVPVAKESGELRPKQTEPRRCERCHARIMLQPCPACAAVEYMAGHWEKKPEATP